MSQHAPVFSFRISSMQENQLKTPYVDGFGTWHPPRSLNSNVQNINETDSYFYCDGTRIYTLDGVPERSRPFKTYSVYYNRDRFLLVNFDATKYTVGDGRDHPHHPVRHNQHGDNAEFRGNWQDLHFEDGGANTNYSSIATYGGEIPQLPYQRGHDQAWPRVLLPMSYHAAQERFTPYTPYGGINGELPLVLALLAFSVEPQNMVGYFTNYFRGRFAEHGLPHGRYDRRGLVVQVWTREGHSTPQALEEYENGQWGNIFP